jgi:hypothetical protein
MVAILGFSREQVRAAVKDMYTAVAITPDHPFHFPVGRDACRQVGYPAESLDGLPEAALESFARVGYPFRAGAIGPGHAVLDVGSGSGTDALIAARLVGPEGKIWALVLHDRSFDRAALDPARPHEAAMLLARRRRGEDDGPALGRRLVHALAEAILVARGGVEPAVVERQEVVLLVGGLTSRTPLDDERRPVEGRRGQCRERESGERNAHRADGQRGHDPGSHGVPPPG